MNLWRRSLAPKKSGQLTFSRSRNNENDETLELKLYGINIPLETNPKFLGVFFDRKLTFKFHFEMVQKKLTDRLNPNPNPNPNIYKLLQHFFFFFELENCLFELKLLEWS